MKGHMVPSSQTPTINTTSGFFVGQVQLWLELRSEILVYKLLVDTLATSVEFEDLTGVEGKKTFDGGEDEIDRVNS